MTKVYMNFNYVDMHEDPIYRCEGADMMKHNRPIVCWGTQNTLPLPWDASGVIIYLHFDGNVFELYKFPFYSTASFENPWS